MDSSNAIQLSDIHIFREVAAALREPRALDSFIAEYTKRRALPAGSVEILKKSLPDFVEA